MAGKDLKRAVITVAHGHRRFAEMAIGLARSLRLIGDSHWRVLLTDLEHHHFYPAFDEVIRIQIPKEDLWWAKFYGIQATQYDQFLFLDSDCLAFRRLDPIFEFFAGSGLGVQGEYRTEGEWYGADIRDASRVGGVPGMVQLNAGLLYYERGEALEQLLARGREIAARNDEFGWNTVRGYPSEEVCLSMAMAQLGLGRAAPDTADYMNSGVGLVGKLRMDVRRGQCEYLCRRHRLQWVKPYVFHAHFYSKFFLYWRQLSLLERLERYEQQHPFGTFSRTTKLQRSIQRRILKLRGKI